MDLSVLERFAMLLVRPGMVVMLAPGLGGAQIVWGNRGRLAVQPQARWVNLTKAALTAVALGVTAYSRVQGAKLSNAGDDAEAPVHDATTPAPGTPSEAADAQRRLTTLQWVVPAATGALLVLNAKAGEQQRPGAILRGAVRANVPVKARAAAKAASAATPDVDVPWARVAGAIVGVVAARRMLRRLGRGRGGRRSGRTTARDLMTGDVVTVSTTDSLMTAARRMVDGDIGSVPRAGVAAVLGRRVATRRGRQAGPTPRAEQAPRLVDELRGASCTPAGRRNDGPDAPGGRTIMREVDAILRRCPDLGVLPEQAEELRVQISRIPVGAIGSSSLTAAELRLLPMLPTHLTFREIGGRLFVSPDTVKTQAISIYRKLGVT